MSTLKILCVDDEANILQSLRRLLRKEEVDVDTTESPEEALRMVAEETYAVVISDQRMPGMTGTEMLSKVRDISPESVRMTLTGYADIEAAKEAINRGYVYRFLDKPWEDDDLRLAVRQALDQYRLVQENKQLQEELRDLNENLKQKVMERTLEVLRLNQSLEHSFMGAVRAMARMTEMHSPVMGSHSRRVASLSKALAKQLGVAGRELRQVEIGAALHDIGKIPIEPAILMKPEPYLDARERAIIRKHPVTGEAIVRMVPNLDAAATFVRHHHERFDGNGYPDGLSKEAIPMGARIIAVVNAYDKALNSRDTFSTMTPEQAYRIVESRYARKFDPDILAALGQMIREGKETEEADEVEINVKDLRPGMVPSRDLVSRQGSLLLPKDKAVQPEQITLLQKHHAKDAILDGIFVHRRWPQRAA